MDRLEAMTILLAAVESGSLSAASRKLRIPLATVSRRVSELEDHLKVRLLLRGHREVQLTDAGQSYVASCRQILDQIAEVERTAAGEYRAPQGELVINTPVVFGRLHVVPVVVEFLRTFPEIRARIQLTERVVNLLEEHVDLAVRIGELRDSSMIAVRVGSIRRVVCASPAYLKLRGTPQKPSDLAAHDCIGHDGNTTSYGWEFSTGKGARVVEVPSRLVLNLGEAALVAAVAGAGIVRVMSYQAEQHVRSGRLVTLLEPFEPEPLPVNLMYPAQRQLPLKLRAFLDFAAPRLRKALG